MDSLDAKRKEKEKVLKKVADSPERSKLSEASWADKIGNKIEDFFKSFQRSGAPKLTAGNFEKMGEILNGEEVKRREAIEAKEAEKANAEAIKAAKREKMEAQRAEKEALDEKLFPRAKEKKVILAGIDVTAINKSMKKINKVLNDAMDNLSDNIRGAFSRSDSLTKSRLEELDERINRRSYGHEV